MLKSLEYRYSKHALEEIQRRRIEKETVDSILKNPGQIIEEKDKKILQSLIEFKNTKNYVVRAIIATDTEPNIVITVYRSSKIKKYWREHES